MSFRSPEEAARRRREIISLGFRGALSFARATDEFWAENTNGVGPDSFSDGERDVLTHLVPYGDLAADLHDLRFRYSDGSRYGFHAANQEWYDNCLIWIRRCRRWWDPRRYIEPGRAAADHMILDGDAGWDAWTSAHERYMEPGPERMV